MKSKDFIHITIIPTHILYIYIAPEALKTISDNDNENKDEEKERIILDGIVDSKYDIFSAGCVLFLIMLDCDPFTQYVNHDGAQTDQDKTFRNIKQNNILVKNWQNPKNKKNLYRKCGQDVILLIDLIKQCLIPDPVQRPSAEQVLKHAFFDTCKNPHVDNKHTSSEQKPLGTQKMSHLQSNTDDNNETKTCTSDVLNEPKQAKVNTKQSSKKKTKTKNYVKDVTSATSELQDDPKTNSKNKRKKKDGKKKKRVKNKNHGATQSYSSIKSTVHHGSNKSGSSSYSSQFARSSSSISRISTSTYATLYIFALFENISYFDIFFLVLYCVDCDGL